MVVENGIIKVKDHVIDSNICMEMKSMMPTMKFTQILMSFESGGKLIPLDEYDEVIDYLEKKWLALKPEDVEWIPIEDESPIE